MSSLFRLSLAQLLEHALFVRLNARLIKGIDTQYKAGEVTGEHEEVEKLSESVFVYRLHSYIKAGEYPAVGLQSPLI